MIDQQLKPLLVSSEVMFQQKETQPEESDYRYFPHLPEEAKIACLIKHEDFDGFDEGIKALQSSQSQILSINEDTRESEHGQESVAQGLQPQGMLFQVIEDRVVRILETNYLQRYKLHLMSSLASCQYSSRARLGFSSFGDSFKDKQETGKQTNIFRYIGRR